MKKNSLKKLAAIIVITLSLLMPTACQSVKPTATTVSTDSTILDSSTPISSMPLEPLGGPPAGEIHPNYTLFIWAAVIVIDGFGILLLIWLWRRERRYKKLE